MTTKIQVLGTGCPKCLMLAEHADRAARELGLDYEIEKISDLERILAFGVSVTPALAVDGVVKIAGHVPSTPRLKDILTAALAVGVR